MANWKHCPEVERAGDVWVFKGVGVPLHRLYETLADGGTVADFARRFGVDVERAAGALEFEADELHDYRLDYAGPVPYARNLDDDRAGPDDALWRSCLLVEQATGRLGGAWVFKRTRLPLYTLHDNLIAGASVEDFVEWYDGVTKAQVANVLAHQAQALRRAQLAYVGLIRRRQLRK